MSKGGCWFLKYAFDMEIDAVSNVRLIQDRLPYDSQCLSITSPFSALWYIYIGCLVNFGSSIAISLVRCVCHFLYLARYSSFRKGLYICRKALLGILGLVQQRAEPTNPLTITMRIACIIRLNIKKPFNSFDLFLSLGSTPGLSGAI